MDFLLLIGYFLIGIIVFLLVTMYDMRGKEFNPEFFNDFMDFDEVIFFILIWPIVLIIALILILLDKCKRKIKQTKHKSFTKLLYNIANIGLEKDVANLDQEEQ